MARREAFGEDEGAIMIEPDINIKDKFEAINLPCNMERRVNNTFNAPMQPVVGIDLKKKAKVPQSTKTYDTDTDNNTASEAEDHQINSGHTKKTVNFEKAQ